MIFVQGSYLLLNNHKITNTFIVEKNFNICLTFQETIPSSGQNACLKYSTVKYIHNVFVTLSTKDIHIFLVYNGAK